jgi:hypothetical protein
VSRRVDVTVHPDDFLARDVRAAFQPWTADPDRGFIDGAASTLG